MPERIAFQAIRIALALGRTLPRAVALPLFATGGAFFHALEKKGRERARENLGLVFGEKRKAKMLARRVYRDLGRNAADLARLETIQNGRLGELVDLVGFERLENALASGRGVIGITAHLGNWELLAACLGERGVPLHVFAGNLFDPRLDERLVRLRARHGVESILRSERGWLRKGVRVLGRGEMLGIVMDLRCRTEGIVIDFLGRPARTFAGPVRLAARTGAVVLPMACWMTEGNRYRIVIDEPVPVATGPLAEERLEESTQECLRSLERFIREAPTQWVWMHDRWNAGAA